MVLSTHGYPLWIGSIYYFYIPKVFIIKIHNDKRIDHMHHFRASLLNSCLGVGSFSCTKIIRAIFLKRIIFLFLCYTMILLVQREKTNKSSSFSFSITWNSKYMAKNIDSLQENGEFVTRKVVTKYIIIATKTLLWWLLIVRYSSIKNVINNDFMISSRKMFV